MMMMKKSQEFPIFVGLRKGTYSLAGPRNVSVEIVCACGCLCMVYPFESEEVTAEFCIGGQNRMLSDKCVFVYKKLTRAHKAHYPAC